MGKHRDKRPIHKYKRMKSENPLDYQDLIENEEINIDSINLECFDPAGEGSRVDD